jgi:dipeptidyl aminopeptidase/acylaminoacyl peptidase
VPVLLIHGDKDENVPVTQTTSMADALRNHGKQVETLIVPGATHYFTEQQYATALRKLFEFLRRHLNRGS